MIEDIPTAEEFTDSGKGLLDVAWETVIGLFENLSDAERHGYELDEIAADYWTASRRKLATSLTIAQQGVEFLLKARIASVSPFLLLADSPEKWPRKSDSLQFSDFRTIDASSLIRVHNTVCASKLSEEFSTRFNAFRDVRNKLSHTVNKALVIEGAEVLRMVLFFHSELITDVRWASTRKSFVRVSALNVLINEDDVTNIMCSEIEQVLKILTPAESRKYFLVDRNKTRYLCPNCYENSNSDYDFETRLAVLKSRSGSHATLYCPVCDGEKKVDARSCSPVCCTGALFGCGRYDEEICLLCGCAAPE